MHCCLERPLCSVHVYVSEVETACIINDPFSGYETLDYVLWSNNHFQ